MSRVRLTIEITLFRFGAPAVLLAAVTMALAVGSVWHLVSLRAEAASLRTAARASVLAAQGAAHRETQSEANLRRLAEFERLLGREDELDAYLLQLASLAKRLGLKPSGGEYRLVEDPGGGFARYHVVMPVEANGRSIQNFVETLLLEVPFAAVEEISLQRQTVGASAVSARLKLVYFLRSSIQASARTSAPQALRSSSR